MNRKSCKTLAISIAICLSTSLLTAQTRELSLDSSQARRELEIMKGILETTLRFSAESPEADVRLAGSLGMVDGFYLYGQGAVFMVPIHRDPVRTAELASLEGSLAQLRAQNQASDAYLRAMEMRLDANRALYSGMLQRQLEYVAPSVLAPPPPAPPAPPTPSQVPEPPLPPPPQPESDLLTDEALEERLEDIERRLQEKKQQAEKRQAEDERRLDRLRDELISAVAKHGQSLSLVKADEYITLILTPGHTGLVRWGDRGARSRNWVLTIPRSAITAFQSNGDLDQLRRSVIEYEM